MINELMEKYLLSEAGWWVVAYKDKKMLRGIPTWSEAVRAETADDAREKFLSKHKEEKLEIISVRKK